MALSITETVCLRGQNKSRSTAHLATNWALRSPLQKRWAPGEVGHREPRQHKSPRVPGAETQRQCDAHPGTTGRYQIFRANKPTVCNSIRRYGKTKSLKTHHPSDAGRILPFVRLVRSLAAN